MDLVDPDHAQGGQPGERWLAAEAAAEAELLALHAAWLQMLVAWELKPTRLGRVALAAPRRFRLRRFDGTP